MQTTLRWMQRASVPLSLMIVGLTVPSQANPEGGLYILYEVRGDVRLKRSGWSDYQPVYAGDLLSGSDYLQIASGASASVDCDNGAPWSVTTAGEFLVSSGCGSSRGPGISSSNGIRQPSRGYEDPTIPYLISPRNTSLITGQPIFRWNPITGADHYQVQVKGPNGFLWASEEIRQTEVVYSGTQPFRPGDYYQVVVNTDTGISSAKDPVGFSVLLSEETAEIEAEAAQIKQLPVDEHLIALRLAYLYRDHNLQNEAIQVLQEQIDQEAENAVIYQLQADLYQEIGLLRLARERYEQALEQSQQERSVARQATILNRLGDVAQNLDELVQAITWLEAAQANYQLLGDEMKVSEMQERIDYLRPRVPQ